MPLTLNLDAIANLPHAPASDVKKIGWRGIMKAVARDGKLVVTHHNAPDAVILSIAEYDAMVQALRDAAAPAEVVLDLLRQRFDERLAALQTDDASDRLRTLLRQPAKLGGKVKAAAR
ncbi:MAG: type II toxin-antitoxin system prevent-host-death family antitoxin [Xanthomonadaceae bacterium]|nr:type II toxin-antitoxin system prevent-host-death family antitoxin [Xanthomonadaceae bacterium]MDP2185061.1 type II toxin-antitoxin system prevent-host-death family antitoxin [Xanthomonadales bacterium]MDZ4117115.1 type II toxin-antitoxin system prevent-host-death family antitoxin [Xanthomonadaceae bacterium]MDZ4378584.1 type II toxin-antitoxin system prevent-host-death family antitoxin [Xanthomonadaceae bacterium]